MLEREIRDAQYIKRWGIVRKIRDQDVAQHTFVVAHFVNDFCVVMGLSDEVCLRAIRQALWHDMDEIFSGDMAGPAKREAVSDRNTWTSWFNSALAKTFELISLRNGYVGRIKAEKYKAIVKAADWLESACEGGAEVQMGNQNMVVHYLHDSKQAKLATINMLAKWGFSAESGAGQKIYQNVCRCIEESAVGQSAGPVIAEEMKEANAMKDSHYRGAYSHLYIDLPSEVDRAWRERSEAV